MTLSGKGLISLGPRVCHLSPSASAHISAHLLLTVFLCGIPFASTQSGRADDSDMRIGPSFDPRMVILLLVMVVIFMILAFFSLYIRHCMWRNLNSPPGQPDGLEARAGGRPRRRKVPQGLDAEGMEKFPTFEYSTVKSLKIGKGGSECAVCLNEFEDDETLRLIPHCSHVFHQECVDVWLSGHATCPVCRSDLTVDPGKTVFFPSPTATGSSVVVDIGGGETSRRVPLDSRDAHLVESMAWANRKSLRKAKSTELSRWHVSGLPPRSKSTGLAPPDEMIERFTLRLPEEVWNALVKSSLDRTRSPSSTLPRVRSSREGYKSPRMDRETSWFDRYRRAFSFSPRFLTQAGPAKSPNHSGKDGSGTDPPPRGLAEPSRSPLDQLNSANCDAGERSSDRLWPADSRV